MQHSLCDDELTAVEDHLVDGFLGSGGIRRPSDAVGKRIESVEVFASDEATFSVGDRAKEGVLDFRSPDRPILGIGGSAC